MSGIRSLWPWAAGFAALYSLGWFWGLPSILTSASDSVAPLGPLAFAADLRDPNKSYIYPAVHQLLLLAVYAIAIGAGKLAGVVGAISGKWPYGFQNPTAMFSALLFLSNLVGTLMALAVLACLHEIRIFEPSRRGFGVALLGLSGVFTYYARVGNMDVPYLCWWMLSYAALWAFLFRSPQLRYLLLSSFAGALSIGTKDQAVGLLLGSGLLLLLLLPAEENGPRGPLVQRLRNAGIFSAGLLSTYGIVAVLTNPARWWHHFRYITMDHVPDGHNFPIPEFPGTAYGQLQELLRVLTRLGNVITPMGVLLGLAGFVLIARARRWRELSFLVVPGLVYYLFVIARVRASEERYLLPLAILLCFGASAAIGIMTLRLGKAATWFAAAVLAFQVAVGVFPITYVQLLDTKRALSQGLPELSPRGDNLLIVNMYSFNLPNADVYDNYRLLHPPGEMLEPVSTHGEHLFSSYTPDHKFILSGSRSPHSDGTLRNAALIRSWTYPDWIKRHIHVPAIYEFFLYRRGKP